MYSRFDFDVAPDGQSRTVPRDLPDPLELDSASDVPVVTTRRRLIRLALVAAETATRFQREGGDRDAMAWMLASRELFDGRDAIEATLELAHCKRAILLHGLGIGLDAAPAMVDYICSEDDPSN